MNLFRNHGITKNKDLMINKNEGPWYYEQIALGLNYRLTDIAAALGLNQLKRVDKFVSRRNKIAERYNHLIDDNLIEKPIVISNCMSSFHLYSVKPK